MQTTFSGRDARGRTQRVARQLGRGVDEGRRLQLLLQPPVAPVLKDVVGVGPGA